MERRSGAEIADDDEFIISTLPKTKGWFLNCQYEYEGFWYELPMIKGTLLIKNKPFYNSSSSDHNVLLASHPKTGATWLKSIIFAVTNRDQYAVDCKSHPVLTSNSHEFIPFIEFYPLNNLSNPVPEDTSLLSTHIPFHSLPDSIKSSDCRIVYVYRDPKDVLISLWHFANQFQRSTGAPLIPLEDAVDRFIQGMSVFGPYWDHVLTYLEESGRNSERIQFVSYEEMKRRPVECLRKLASFIGKPFSEEEEKGGVAESIVDLCSFKKLRDLDVNQAQHFNKGVPNAVKISNDTYFRKGEVGDHLNYMTEDMIQRIDNITEQKLGDKLGDAGLFITA